MDDEQLPVSLREVSTDNLHQVLKLQVDQAQKNLVAANAYSLAEAHFEPKAWFRAIYAGEQPVGFVMLYIDLEKPTFYLWRYMVDARYQGKGYGRQAMLMLIDFVRSHPQAREFFLSCVPAENGPEHFYRKFGFVETGECDGEEMVMRLAL